MLLAVDVDYHSGHAGGTACVAGVVFDEWWTKKLTSAYVTNISEVSPYRPGNFYQRELPCILELLRLVIEPIDIIIVDGYVWLDEAGTPGWGAHLFQLFEPLGCGTSVVGVAKSLYLGSAHAITLNRGESKKPLYVTAAGMDLRQASDCVLSMAGSSRIPAFLSLVDQLCRRTVWISRQRNIVHKGQQPQVPVTSTKPYPRTVWVSKRGNLIYK